MKQLEKRFNEVTKDSGVTVIETGLSAPNISHDLAEAIRNIGIATALAKQKVIDAGAEQTKIVKIGEGAASAEAALIQAIEDKLKNASPATIATYAGQKILSDKTTVLGVEGIAQAFGLGKEITSEINRRNS